MVQSAPMTPRARDRRRPRNKSQDVCSAHGCNTTTTTIAIKMATTATAFRVGAQSRVHVPTQSIITVLMTAYLCQAHANTSGTTHRTVSSVLNVCTVFDQHTRDVYDFLSNCEPCHADAVTVWPQLPTGPGDCPARRAVHHPGIHVCSTCDALQDSDSVLPDHSLNKVGGSAVGRHSWKCEETAVVEAEPHGAIASLRLLHPARPSSYTQKPHTHRRHACATRCNGMFGAFSGRLRWRLLHHSKESLAPTTAAEVPACTSHPRM